MMGSLYFGIVGKRGETQGLMTILIVLSTLIMISLIVSWVVNTENCDLAKSNCDTEQQKYCFDWWKQDRTLSTGRPSKLDIKSCDENGKEIECQTPNKQLCEELLS